MPDPSLEDLLAEVRDLGLDDNFDATHQRVLGRLGASIGAQQAQQRRSLSRWRSKRRRHPVVTVIGAAGLTLCLGAAGYAVVADPQPNLSRGIACYSNTDRSGGVDATVPDGRTAIAICSQAWQDGQITAAGQPGAKTTTAAVPTLQACVDPSGKLAIQVIPSATAGICAKYGLVSEPDAGARGARSYAKLMSALFDADSVRCLSLAGAQAVAQKALADAALTSTWRIRVSSDQLTTLDPCMQFGNDDAQRVIYIDPGSTPGDNPDDRTPGN